MTDWTDVCQDGDLENGQCRIVDVDDTMIAVFHQDGGYYAIQDMCTHDGGELASGEVEGDEVICPRHGARFCIKNGKALSAPAYEDVDTFPTRVENGVVQVRDDRFD
ncbi:non-heme iron oxygenase ferredoxin subunit [Salinisphaera sp. Q1T1-3]|uniref:non-heme iron oxygenase ferredoxin subunit n=1 Tax=Salinisphaera sp. Q1T1-3 TaxID=2321229 RepID=UPI000E73DE8C|nr:non-heme iron oxygenase ferredoxin subunit [Salinisphaera sp. Q1T1-3]RJS95316.1 non-heme iron oxygenase ferredoxin subunit [Salinisphaera sp. Q1T1-3]